MVPPPTRQACPEPRGVRRRPHRPEWVQIQREPRRHAAGPLRPLVQLARLISQDLPRHLEMARVACGVVGRHLGDDHRRVRLSLHLPLTLLHPWPLALIERGDRLVEDEILPAGEGRSLPAHPVLVSASHRSWTRVRILLTAAWLISSCPAIWCWV